MKKAIAYFFTLCLLTALSPAALAKTDLGEIDASDASSESAMFNYAKLQMEQAAAAKNEVAEQMNQIQQAQEEQKQVTGYLKEARALQAEARSSETATQMPGDMQSYLDSHGLSYDRTGEDNLHDSDEWMVAIQSLQDYQEQVSTDLQRQLVSIQDFMGQYNAYVQNANASMQPQMGTLSSVARGQSLFSTAGVTGLPPIATSLLAGVAIGLLSMWAIQRSKRRRKGV